MHQVKFSLKKNKFIQRKHPIFQKKQSLTSLQIHEPQQNDQTHLFPQNQNQYLCHNRQHTQSSASSFQYMHQDQNFSELMQKNNSMHEKTQFVSIEGYDFDKIVQNTSQLDLPLNRIQEQKQSAGNITSQSGLKQSSYKPHPMSELIWVRLLLLQNQERIHQISDSFSKISKSTAQLYQDHAKKLQIMVSKRCEQFTKIFQKICIFLKAKCQRTQQIDQRVSLFYNTLKQTKQSIRLLAIKQQCLELLVAQQKPTIIQKAAKTRIKQPYSKNHILCPFQATQISHWEKEIDFEIKDKWDLNQEEFNGMQGSGIKSPLHQRMRDDSFMLNSEKKWNQKSEYTFHENELLDQKSNNYEYLVKRVNNGVGKSGRVWLDNLNCLRTQIGGYLLDRQGNAIICTPADLNKLIKDGILYQKHG